MELLLNLVWLVAALAVVWAAIARARSKQFIAAGPGLWALGVTVFCLCVVLFPAISMTDDLQQVTFGSEESTQSLIVADAHSRVHANLEFLLLAILLVFAATLASFDLARRAFIAKSPLEGFIALIISRPPPAFVS
jgi:hypothetical protein